MDKNYQTYILNYGDHFKSVAIVDTDVIEGITIDNSITFEAPIDKEWLNLIVDLGDPCCGPQSAKVNLWGIE